MIRRILAVVAAVAVMASCADNKALKTNKYEKFFEEGLTEDSEDTMSILVDLEYPTAGVSFDVLTRMTNAIVGHSNLDEPTGIGSAVENYVQTRYANYLQTNLPLYEEMQRDGEEYSFDWDDYIEGYFVGRWKDIVSYRLDTYTYSGGAHGSSGTYCYNFDVNTGNIVKDSAMFKDGFETKMSELLTSHLCNTFDCGRDYDSLFVKELTPSANYCVTSDGIDYIYEQYELGPAYLGCIQVHIPWSELKDLIR